MSVREDLDKANSRLKAFKVPVRIREQDGRLYLRGTFPPRPNSAQEKPHQQRLALKLASCPRTVVLAEKEARKVGVLLEAGEFSWEPYIRRQSIGSVAGWVAQLRHEYFAAGGSEITWKGDYQQAFDKLPVQHSLSLKLLLKVAKEIPANTKQRQRVCMSFARLARFAGIEADRIVALRGSYSSKSVDPRSLPLDSLIAKWRDDVAHPAWRWCFGMLAVYGLRPHELFRCDLDDFPTVRVEENSKTGYRFVWPLYPEWAEEWNLKDRRLPALENIESLPNAKLGSKVSRRFYAWQLLKPDGKSLCAYDLRHCYARRCFEFGFSPDFSSRMMGHSLDTHMRVYRRWIDEGVYRAIYEATVNRERRPRPPKKLDMVSHFQPTMFVPRELKTAGSLEPP
ncbi:MAG: integrase [Cyanobacteria bacterium J06614_10]